MQTGQYFLCGNDGRSSLEDLPLQQIPTALAAAGMVLAKDVKTTKDRILCGKSTVLDERLIDRLQKMDITHITVKGHPVTIEGEKSLKEEISYVEERFSRVTHIPPLMYLKKRIIKRLIETRRRQ